VTILATNAALSGKTLSLQNIQIVNGLQTTESIFRHFQGGRDRRDDRTVLVKVLVSTDNLVRDKIIRATNNQNAVELASLHATDKIQRDIEDILERSEWFYERRKNYYRNIGKPAQRFVTPLYLAACVLSLVFKNPARAPKLKTRFMRNPISYAAVFSEDFPLSVWPVIVSLTKKVEDELLPFRHGSIELGDRFIAKWRGLVSLICVARLLGKFDYSIYELLGVSPDSISSILVAEVWQPIQAARASNMKANSFRKPGFVVQQCEEAAATFGLSGVASVGRRQLPSDPAASGAGPLNAVLLEAVEKLLVQFGTNPAPHKTIAEQLGCSVGMVKSAIRIIRKRTAAPGAHPKSSSG
jgi:hypothetical protein